MKDKVLFIGSFIKPKNGSYGGVLFASTSLRDKLINEGYKVVELDTTLKDISVTKVSKRFGNIFLRQLKFLYRILTTRKAKTLLVFVSAGNSYIDKLPSIFLAKLLK